jgi:hypothetical protein
MPRLTPVGHHPKPHREDLRKECGVAEAHPAQAPESRQQGRKALVVGPVRRIAPLSGLAAPGFVTPFTDE